jgi:hypothetical protein
MSTIKVTNIQDTSGGNQSTSEQIAQGRAKAWVNFDGTFGTSPYTIANEGISDSFNVTSVTDNGTGNYTVNFTNDMPNANYAVVVSSYMTGSNSFAAYERIDSLATSSFLIRTVHSSSFQDISLVCAAVYGD